MSMVCGLDLHRRQITFDAVVPESGEAWRGRLWSPDRERFRDWLRGDLARRAGDGPVDISVEGCTGWRYVVEEIQAAGFTPHVAEPADTRAQRGRKKRAKTDRCDARLQRELLQAGKLPESWIPPALVLEWRERTRLYHCLVEQRREWLQRVHAECFQHGVALPAARIRSTDTSLRDRLADPALQLSPAARERLGVYYRMIEAANTEIDALRTQIERFAAVQPACRTLRNTHFGIGPVTAVTVWVELGDCQRFSSSDQAVRHSGLDPTVDSSDLHRPGGFLAREGPATLRWALFEAAKCASRATSPDHDYYQHVKARHDGKIAALSVARKLVRRCYHTLKSLDPDQVYAIPD